MLKVCVNHELFVGPGSPFLIGPTSVASVEDLKVNTVLTNNGDETIKVLKDPLGPLSQLPAETFTIESEGGAQPAFMGIKAKYSPKAAIAAGEYVTLAPGESVSVAHDCECHSTPCLPTICC